MCYSGCRCERHDGTCRFEKNCPCDFEDNDIEEWNEEIEDSDSYLTELEYKHLHQYIEVEI